VTELATAAATSRIATKRTPLPVRIVAKKRSLRSSIRSRATATNHRKATPANGTR
jgi:hypothetical protein